MRPQRIIGWDLGGAHLKAACIDVASRRICSVEQLACPLWEGVAELRAAIDQILVQHPEEGVLHAVTMTGELVDAFASREAGVHELLEVIGARVSPAALKVYAGSDGLLPVDEANRNPLQVASANWLASASMICQSGIRQSGIRQSGGEGVFVDIGSTTTDIVLFANGEIRVRGFTDYDRQRFEELLYTGVVRTPLVAIARRAPFAGTWVTLAAEHFATMADVYRLTGELPEHADLHPAADQGPKTVAGSARRLARMLGCDFELDDSELGELERWRAVARYLAERQLALIDAATRRQLSRDLISPQAPVVGAGVGRFIIEKLAARLGRPFVDFGSFCATATECEADPADCAPAVAVATLALHLSD